jgi:hypothetical protein
LVEKPEQDGKNIEGTKKKQESVVFLLVGTAKLHVILAKNGYVD